VNGVNLRNNENIEKALKRFKKVVERAGVIYDIKKYRYFEKPSEKKKEARKEALRKGAQENS
jgi:small subunit ribosomal protein S21